MDYEFDVFISYRRHRLAREWIKLYFRDELEKYLETEINRPPRIFWDETSIDDGGIPRLKVLAALLRSRCAVSVLSLHYFSSSWCSLEWNNFFTKGQKQRKPLLFPILWHDCEDYDQVFGDSAPKAPRFDNYRKTAPGWPRTDSYVEFQGDVEKLSKAIGNSIRGGITFDPNWDVGDPDLVRPLKSATGEWVYKLAPPAGNG